MRSIVAGRALWWNHVHSFPAGPAVRGQGIGHSAGDVAGPTNYTATVNGTASNGVAMASADSWSFTTSNAPPTGRWVIRSSPIPSFYFGSTIISTGVTMTVIDLSNGGASVAGTTSYSSPIASFTPAIGPVPGRNHQVTASGATAPDGTPMVAASMVFTAGGGGGFFGLYRAGDA
jgi:hypothetical protein